jgi:Uma2 family endonuclease
MPAIHATLMDETVIEVPAWVIDNASFLRWAESEDAPDHSKVGFINGTVWFNNTMEQILHNQIKAAIIEEIRIWNRALDLGCYYPDGMVYSNLDLEFTTVPDGIFVTNESIANGAIVLDRGMLSTKITGSPDIVLEVITRSSVEKDLSELRPLYFDAGIREYWIIDSRVKEPVLQIMKRGKEEFTEAKSIDGWVPSKVLKGSFRLRFDEMRKEYRLDSKSP